MKSVPRPKTSERAAGTAIVGEASKAVPAAPVVQQASTPRQWNLKMALASVMIVLLGGLLMMYAIPAYSHRSSVLVTARAVSAGTRLQPADLTVAQVSVGADVATVSEDRRDAMVGLIAKGELPAGTLVNPALVSRDDGFAAGQVIVPLALKAGQMPARGLTVGQKVTVVSTPPNTVSAEARATSIDAVVAGTGSTTVSTGVTVVDVRVNADQGANLAQVSASGTVVVVAHPVGK